MREDTDPRLWSSDTSFANIYDRPREIYANNRLRISAPSDGQYLQDIMFGTYGHDSITLHYQPLLERQGSVGGMEALMRWHHQERGPISPEAFIPIFEQSGLIVPLSRWALGQACVDAASWPRPLIVAVNLSAMQFDKENLPGLVRSVLAQSGLAAQRLELEVTAASFGKDLRRTAATMTRLRSEGVKIALADFGGDRSSPRHLADFPFSKIKIARNLIANLENSASARSIVHMIIELAHAKQLSVAAEGIETPAQLSFLEDEGCDWLQGFLIGHPAPIDQHAAATGAPASDQAGWNDALSSAVAAAGG